jgi:hypothetical protein
LTAEEKNTFYYSGYETSFSLYTPSAFGTSPLRGRTGGNHSLGLGSRAGKLYLEREKFFTLTSIPF